MTSIYQGAGIAIDLAYMATLSRLLSPADFGVMATAILFLSFCNLLREIGLGATIVQLPSLTEVEQRTALTLVLISSAILFILAQACAAPFARFMNMPASEVVVRALSFIIIVQAFTSISEGLLLRRLEMRRIRMSEIAAKTLAYGTTGIGLAFAGFGYWALAAASICEASFLALVLVYAAKPNLRPIFDNPSSRRLMGKGSGFTASRVINFIALRADIAIVGRSLDAVHLGLYSRAYRLMSLPTDVYARMADRVVFPAMAKVQSNPARLKKAYLRGVGLTALFGMPMSAVIYILAPEIVLSLLGKQWGEVIPVFSFLAVGMYFRLASRVSGSLLRATAAIRALILSQAVYACLTICGTLLVVGHGLSAVATAVGLAIFVYFCVITAFACKVARVSLIELIIEHRYGMRVSAMVGIPCFVIAYVLRLENAHASIILLCEILYLGLFSLCFVYRMPINLIGNEGAEFSGHMRSAIRSMLRSGRNDPSSL
ncbi:lipopolysaccharide biosynthesis protein [Rhizobium azibense]|uniref:PST family polysaccharide transporter n=1 Tax=Rhizobium azibense TaxID=1136135 RepID=A0A4R3RQJ7_9HYPH|nr:lipopolysaccharide biosynthesis protein [Rhizobium azibense]TCU33846.1 PST family polysaccharide transporter [Rhizobium azibense]